MKAKQTVVYYNQEPHRKKYEYWKVRFDVFIKGFGWTTATAPFSFIEWKDEIIPQYDFCLN